MTNQQQEKIEQILQDLIGRMSIVASIEAREQDSVTVFNVRTEDSGILIGGHGSNLEALQYMTRILASKELEEPVRFVVDVENYKREREEFLRELGKQAAQRVRETKEALLLKPMMAYERRVVHEAVSEYSDVTTESQGEEPERRIVIKPRQS